MPSMSWNYLSHAQTSTAQSLKFEKSNFFPHFIIDIIIYPYDKQQESIKLYLYEYNLGPFTNLD